jgi:hypothetical protein
VTSRTYRRFDSYSAFFFFKYCISVKIVCSIWPTQVLHYALNLCGSLIPHTQFYLVANRCRKLCKLNLIGDLDRPTPQRPYKGNRKNRSYVPQRSFTAAPTHAVQNFYNPPPPPPYQPDNPPARPPPPRTTTQPPILLHTLQTCDWYPMMI